MTHVGDDDGQLRVESVVHLADGSLVTPEGVVVLTVLGVRVTDRGERLVPGRGVGVRLRHAVGRLPVKTKRGDSVDRCRGNKIRRCRTLPITQRAFYLLV